jgi:hypothetical protein
LFSLAKIRSMISIGRFLKNVVFCFNINTFLITAGVHF